MTSRSWPAAGNRQMNKSAQITILMDNTAAEPLLATEHGLSMWIEVGDQRILWDTGQTDKAFKNAAQLGIDIGSADIIAISHGHYDHTGGLAEAIALASHARLYLHPKAMEQRFSLKKDICRAVGMPHSAQLAVIEKDMADGLCFIDHKTELAGGAVLTGPVPRRTPYEDTGGSFFCDSACTIIDSITDDQSLYFDSPKGTVVILGCAHSGVVNILNAVSEWTDGQNIYAVIGGLHLVNADAYRIEQTIAAFRQYDIQCIAPLHCTGSAAMQQIKKAFGDRCLALGAGSHIWI